MGITNFTMQILDHRLDEFSVNKWLPTRKWLLGEHRAEVINHDFSQHFQTGKMADERASRADAKHGAVLNSLNTKSDESDADDRARLRRAPVTVTGSVANIAAAGAQRPRTWLLITYSITVVVNTARPPTAAASYQTDRTYSPLQVQRTCNRLRSILI